MSLIKGTSVEWNAPQRPARGNVAHTLTVKK